MASRAAAGSTARRLSSTFFSTKPRARPPKPAPEPAPAPKGPAPQAVPKPDERRKSSNLNKILNFVSRERDPDKLVHWLIAESTASGRFRDHHRVYKVAVARLASFGRHDAIAALIDSQKPFIESSDVGFAARLVRLYGRAYMPSHAAAIFHDLPPSHKSVMTFNALLAAYADASDFDSLATAFKQIAASHPTIVPNVHSYNRLIGALCQKSDLSALDVIRLMEMHIVSPDITSFNILLNGFYRNNSFDHAEKVWEMMKERNVEPDVKSYNAKLRGFVSQGRVEDAVALIERMEKEGPKPDSVSYNELIRGYCKEGRLNEAKKVYDDLIKNGCAPNTGTFHTLVPHLVEAGELDRALSCCYEIISRKCRVQRSLLQGVATALIAASRMEEATRIVHLGKKNHYSRKGLRMPPHNFVEGETDSDDSVSYSNEDGYEEEEKSKNTKRGYTFVI